MTTQMIIRMDETLKNQSSRLAKREGKSLSELVRDLLTRHARERDAENHIEQLWERMGQTLSANGITEADAIAAIAQARKKHD